MNLAKSYTFFKPEMVKNRIHIIGCGAIGSTLAENLARFGLGGNITLYDFDYVEEHNVANQMFTYEDIGKLKVNAVAELISRIDPDAVDGLRVVEKGYTGQKLSGYVFLCVDNIDLRREIAESFVGNPNVKAFFDFRMRLTDAQHFAADWSDDKMVKAFINSMQFSHDEAKEETPVSACNMTLSVCPTVRTIVAYGVSNFINFVKGEGIRKLILIDAFAYSLDAFK